VAARNLRADQPGLADRMVSDQRLLAPRSPRLAGAKGPRSLPGQAQARVAPVGHGVAADHLHRADHVQLPAEQQGTSHGSESSAALWILNVAEVIN
jgi:hypothetical protein